jgi:hypothetical protein
MTTATDFEKLGVFYLGRPWDLATRKPKPGLVLYDSKDLVTHAVCVGMTGSGKTGLCLALLEEAAIDGIPALVIDPKGMALRFVYNGGHARHRDDRHRRGRHLHRHHLRRCRHGRHLGREDPIDAR